MPVQVRVQMRVQMLNRLRLLLATSSPSCTDPRVPARDTLRNGKNGKSTRARAVRLVLAAGFDRGRAVGGWMR